VNTLVQTDSVICRCLGVTESQVRDAVVLHGCETVRDVGVVSEAGEGCTVCHCKIKQLISEVRRQRVLAAFSGDGCGL
jgi:NifU-like protein